MSQEELIEMAELEALGVLDEYEQALFNRSFVHAASAVQEEIRNLQASITADASLLSDDEPPTELRHQVLAAVAHAIDEENEQLAPLATIGGSSRHQIQSRLGESAVVGRVYLWRAAAFALAAGLLVSLFFLGKLVDNNSTITELKVSEGITKELEGFAGVELLDMFNRKHHTRAIAAVRPSDANGEAGGSLAGVNGIVLLDDVRNCATILVFGLPVGGSETFHIRVTDLDGGVTRLEEPIRQRPGSTTAVAHLGKILPEVIALAQVGLIEIIDGNGNVIMRSV